MEPIKKFTSRGFAVPEVNIDTDQIIPARFLSVTDKAGLSDACFHDWRFDADGKKTDHMLNCVLTDSHSILIGGMNFGSGSSREHAVWALKDFGVRAVVTTRAADIFKSNALKNGLVVAEIEADHHSRLMAQPDQDIEIDLEANCVRYAGGEAGFTLEAFGRLCLMRGIDQLGYLLEEGDAIGAFEAARGDAA